MEQLEKRRDRIMYNERLAKTELDTVPYGMASHSSVQNHQITIKSFKDEAQEQYLDASCATFVRACVLVSSKHT